MEKQSQIKKEPSFYLKKSRVTPLFGKTIAASLIAILAISFLWPLDAFAGKPEVNVSRRSQSNGSSELELPPLPPLPEEPEFLKPLLDAQRKSRQGQNSSNSSNTLGDAQQPVQTSTQIWTKAVFESSEKRLETALARLENEARQNGRELNPGLKHELRTKNLAEVNRMQANVLVGVLRKTFQDVSIPAWMRFADKSPEGMIDALYPGLQDTNPNEYRTKVKKLDMALADALVELHDKIEKSPLEPTVEPKTYPPFFLWPVALLLSLITAIKIMRASK